MTGWLIRLAALLAGLIPAGLAADAPASSAPLLPAHVLVAADMRDGLDLSGPWHWSIDPYRDGLAGDDAALADAAARNLTFRGGGGDPAGVAADLRALAGRLVRSSDEQLLTGTIAS